MILMLIGHALAACTETAPIFEDYLDASGLRGYSNSRGANFNDFDGDGDLDIFLAVAPARIDGALTFPGEDRLYLNQGNLHFIEAGAAYGIDDMCEDRSPMFGDLDGDDDPDLFVTVNGRSVVYRNQGYEWYEDVTAESGEAGALGWGHQGFLFDYDQDGFVDVFFTNGPEDGSGYNRLLHNQGDGTYRDVSTESGIAGDPSGKGTCVLDADNDGWMDVFVATGREYANHLYINQQDGTFTDEAIARGVSDPFHRFGVGANCGDVNNDGYVDILLITHDRTWSGNQLFINQGPSNPGSFTDVAPGTRLSEMLDGHGSALVDFDMDGWLDIILSGINLPAYVLRNDQHGNFEELCNGAGIRHDDALTWSVATGDLNGDAYPEVYISQGLGTRPRDDEFYRNLGGDNHWLTVKVRGAGANRSALGTRIDVTAEGITRTRWVGSWSSFDSQGPLAVSVGLGDATQVEKLKITFPTGEVWEDSNLETNQYLEIEEPGIRPDADADGVPDEWDLCAETPIGLRHDGQGCAPTQRGSGLPIALENPAQDTVWVEPGEFLWTGQADAPTVIQLSTDGSFGPAGRLDLPVSTEGHVSISTEFWDWLIKNADPTGPVLWRAVAEWEGRQAISENRRFYVAVPTQTVHIPLGINIFSPAHIVVPVGSAVTWWNDSVSAGNLQNEDHDVAIVNSVGSTLPDLEDLDGGGVYTHVFDSPGTWSYICHRHSGAAVHTDEVFESNYAHRAPGPYRCMSGTVTVR